MTVVIVLLKKTHPYTGRQKAVGNLSSYVFLRTDYV